jgi:alpha-galactosidase
MGNDMRNVTEESKAILKNKDAIAISQDPLGQMGIRITGDLPQQVWARELANGDVAVGLYNKGDPESTDGAATDITIDFKMVDLHGSVTVYDIWKNKAVGSFESSYTAKAVPFHGTAFLRLSAA